MKVLMLSLDSTLLDLNSQSAFRLKKYGQFVDLLEVVVYAKKKVRNLKLADNITIHSTGTKFKPCYLRQAFFLSKKLIKAKELDVITTQDPFETALVGSWLKKKFKVGLNIQMHGDFFSTDYWQSQSLKKKLRFRIARKVLPQADSVRVVSQRIANSLVQFKIEQAKIVIAPIYVNWHQFAEAEIKHDLRKEFPNQYIILSVGRLAKEKNLDLLIEAFAEFKTKYNDSVLVIVGQGIESDYLKQKTKDLQLETEVVFKGFQNDTVGYYKTADVFVAPSMSEGYNRTVIEAMACQCPVIMTDVGLAGEIIHNRENGLVINKDNIKKDLVLALTDLKEHHDFKDQLVSQALQTIQTLPTEEQLMLKQIEAFKKAKQ